MKRLMSVFTAVAVFMSLTVCVFATAENKPVLDFELNTESMLVANLDTDEVYFSQNADVKRVMASTTKIMTYIVIAETVDDLENTMITIEQKPIDDVSGQGASMAGFQNHIGESYSVLDVLYGMMLPSGCDAAEVLAYYAGGGDVIKFVDMMNAKANELGCENTHFNDPHGLSDENHYTTAEDLYKITKYALKMPYFTEIVSEEFYTLPGDTYPIVNTNYLIDDISGGLYYYRYATGIKTGYTSLAGRCLVSTAKKGDTNLCCIALGGEYDEETNYVNFAMLDSARMLDWAFANFTDTIEVTFDAMYKSVQIGDKSKLTANIGKSNINEKPEIKWSSSDKNVAEVDQNGVVTAKSLGKAVIKAEVQTGDFAVCNVSCGFYNGIDVSSRLGDFVDGVKNPIDWTKVKQSGIDFAIIRAGWFDWAENSFQNDSSFVENVRGAVDNDINIGLKFVAYADTADEARQEAQYLIKAIDESIPEYKDKLTLSISYDMATYSHYSELTKDENTAIALAFNEVMKENGFDSYCFAGKAVYKKMDIDALKNENMGIWYSYRPYIPDFNESITVNGEYVPDIWQYTGTGGIPGASENMFSYQDVIYMASAKKLDPPVVQAEQSENENAVEITWSMPECDTAGFAVYRSEGEDAVPEKLADLTADQLSYTDADVELNVSYTYYIGAKATDILNKECAIEVMGSSSPVTVVAKPVKLIGDLNGDGILTTADVGIINIFAQGIQDYTQDDLLLADANGDGEITTADVGIINDIVKSAA